MDFKGNDSPYFAYGRSYIRIGDEDRVLSPIELEKMILHKNLYKSKWDSSLTEYSINSLNNEAITDFINQTELAGRRPVSEVNNVLLLNKLKLANGDLVTYAAWHLFSDNQTVELQTAIFNGVDKSSFSDIKHFRGNIFKLFNIAVDYLKEKMNWRVEFGNDMKRHEIPEVPITAIREALVNSFVHRDYNDPKSNEIAIFDDRIEIYNSGTFPHSLKPEDFFNGAERSYLRNPKIAEMFCYTKDIDRWGSGFQRIKKVCEDNNVNFEIKLLISGLLVVFYKTKFTEPISSPESSEKSSQKSSEKSSEKILNLIKENNHITTSEVALLLNISPRAVAKHFAKLKEIGKIKRVGPDNGGYWEVVDNV